MAERLALLIGVPGCGDAELFDDLDVDVVSQDLTRMRDVLTESGYSIEVLGVAPHQRKGERLILGEASRGRCIQSIRDICNRVPEGGTLLLYFSGHGMRLAGRDYLVPSDAGRSLVDSGPDPESLLDLDISAHVGHCRAKLVALVVDACRNNATDTIDLANFQGIPRLQNGTFWLAMGCDTGQVCRYDTRGSYFTRELTGGLSAKNTAQSMSEVIDVAKARLSAMGQTPRLEHSGEKLDWPICDSITVFGEWWAAAEHSLLWRGSEIPQKLFVAMESSISEYAEVTHRLGETGVDDPWFDQSYPARVIARLTELVPDECLTPVEASLVVLAPFLREAVLALGLFDVRDLDVRNVEPSFRTGLRHDLEAVYSSFAHLSRRVTQLTTSPVDRDALVMWLVYVWLLGREDVWEHAQVDAWCRQAAATVLTTHDLPHTTSDVEECAKMLRALAKCVGLPVDPFDLVSLAAPDLVDDVCRLRPVGRLLSLAGVLAVDPRRMAPVVAEHIGLRDPFPIPELRDVVTNLRWTRDGDHLEMTAACPHPAFHVALEAVALQAEHVRQLSSGHDLYVALPATINAKRLRPATSPDRGIAYQQPLLRFRMATDKVQRLLMGDQLYDSANDAVRELYQNALDACRYRDVRYRFAYQGPTVEIPWQGDIRFRQGDDGDGLYLECEDNGVGMTPEILKTTFAEAGTRFVHSDEFRREQARWERVDTKLRLYANSQFGIGVLSYFMLANEITIWTAPTDQYGRPTGAQYEVAISGDGSLFRIRRTDVIPAGIRNGGTVIRLHLATQEPLDLAKILPSYIVYTEYNVYIDSDLQMRADEIYMSDRGVRTKRVTKDMWWSSGRGAFLSDGLLVAAKNSRHPNSIHRHNSKFDTFGMIINLTGRHRPTLNVNRGRVLDWDQKWIDEQIQVAIPSLTGWPGVSFSWLWRLSRQDEDLVRRIVEHLSDESIKLWPADDSPAIRLRDVGCWPEDEVATLKLYENASYMTYVHVRREYPEKFWLLPWRIRCWQIAGYELRESIEIPESLDGYPAPIDRPAGLSQRINSASLMTSVHRKKATVASTLRSLRPFVIAGLDMRGVRWILKADTVDPLEARIIEAVLAEMHDSIDRIPTPSRASSTGLPHRSLFGLLKLSAKFDSPISYIWEGCQEIPEIAQLATIDTSQMGDYIADDSDIKLLRQDLSGDMSAAIITNISLRRIVQASRTLGMTLAEAAIRLARLKPLGVWCPVQAGWVEDVPANVSDPLSKYIFELDHPPSLTDIFELAAARTDTIGQMCQLLKDIIVSTHLSVELPNIAQCDDVVATLAMAELMSRFDEARRSSLPLRLAIFVENIEKVSSFTDRDDLSHAIDVVAPYWDIECVVTVPILARMSRGKITHFEESVATMRTWLGSYLDFSHLDAGFRYYHLLHVELVTTVEGEWRKPSVLDLMKSGPGRGQSIGDFLGLIEHFRSFGADIPASNTFEDFVADVYDKVMCEENIGANEISIPLLDDIVTPLHLIRVAGRFGWEIARAYDRLAALTPLGLRLSMNADALPEGIVHWQDLIALTTNFDGFSPSVTGVVDSDFIARAADAIGEPTLVTRSRLVRYAGLFRLDFTENSGVI